MASPVRAAARGLGYLLVLTLLVEGLLRFAVPDDTLDDLIIGSSHDMSELYWKTRWQRQARESGMVLGFDRYHPRLGWLSKPKLQRMPVFGDRWLSTNAQGLRASHDFSLERPAGVRQRIALLGDSFTFGEEVSNDQTFAHLLQQALGEQHEVMNFAVHGYGHGQMLLMYRELARRYRPDVVVLGYVLADLARNHMYFRDYAKPYFIRGDGDRVELRYDWRFMPPDRLRAALRIEPRLFNVAWALADSVERSRARHPDLELARAIFTTLRREVEADGARLVMLYLPIGRQVTPDYDRSAPGERRFERLCRAARAECISSAGAFAGALEAGTRFASRGGHWREAGHRVVGEYLAGAMKTGPRTE